MPANDLPSASLALAAGLCLISLFLGLHQWYEWRAREPDLSVADQLHFNRQDLRRGLGVIVLLAIAALVVLGSRLEPRPHGQANVLFVQIWIAVLVLIVVLLTLALADWMAIRSYARRRRRELLRESIEPIRRLARESAGGQSPEALDDPTEIPEA